MLTVNVVVLAGTVAADPVTRRMPSGDEVTELRMDVSFMAWELVAAR
jgi:single-stranded DNA-binding protein